MPELTETEMVEDANIKLDIARSGKCITVFSDGKKESVMFEDLTEIEQTKLIDAYHIVYNKCIKKRDDKISILVEELRGVFVVKLATTCNI